MPKQKQPIIDLSLTFQDSQFKKMEYLDIYDISGKQTKIAIQNGKGGPPPVWLRR